MCWPKKLIFHFLGYNISGKRDHSCFYFKLISAFTLPPQNIKGAFEGEHIDTLSYLWWNITSVWYNSQAHLLLYYIVKHYYTADVAALIGGPLENVAAVASAVALSHNSRLLYSWMLFAWRANTGFPPLIACFENWVFVCVRKKKKFAFLFVPF